MNLISKESKGTQLVTMIFSTTPNFGASLILSLCFPPWFRYYAENSTGRCERCSRSCKSCSGPRPTDCLSCDPFFFLLHSKGQCHRTCPEHYYAEQSTRTCERCHPTCDKCKGEGHLSFHMCEWKNAKCFFLLCPSLLSSPLEGLLACQPHSQSSPAAAPFVLFQLLHICPLTLIDPAPHCCLFRSFPSFRAQIQASSPTASVFHLLSSFSTC